MALWAFAGAVTQEIARPRPIVRNVCLVDINMISSSHQQLAVDDGS